MERKIIVLVGESSSGKDRIMNRLVEKFSLHKIISYTTRPIRLGEKDKVDYIFLNSNDQFDSLFNDGSILEQTKYETDEGLWKYGLAKDGLSDKCTNVCVVNPKGLKFLLSNDEIKGRILPFYITADFKNRFMRYCNRDHMTATNKIELVDRFLRDERDFRDLTKNFDIIETFHNNNESDIDDIVNKIEWIAHRSYL